MKLITKSYDETVIIGKLFSKILHKCDVVCLDGDLGAGKTSFVTGVANGLGHNDYITSPTFTIVNEYDTVPQFFHFDVYRVHEPDELYEIGFEEYFSREGIILIEWSSLIPQLIPENKISITISRIDNIDYNLENKIDSIRLNEFQENIDLEMVRIINFEYNEIYIERFISFTNILNENGVKIIN